MPRISNISHPKYQRSNRYLKSGLGIVLFSSALLMSSAFASPWPIAITDQANASTRQTISIPVIANDKGTGLKITEVNTTTKRLGTASISADKQSVTYRSAADFSGEDTFWYAFKDSQGRTNSAKVTVSVTDKPSKPPQWPTAGRESPEIKYNTATTLDVLANDQGVGLTIKEVNTTSVKLGSVSISADGKKLIYTPKQGFSGNDQFWYVLEDAWGRTNAGKVTPTVLAEKENKGPWPTATPDNASTLSTRSLLIPVLANDQGSDLELVEVNKTTVGLNRASIVNNAIRYVPDTQFSGQDSFWYSFKDKYGRTNSTQVFVSVTENTQLSSIRFCDANYFTTGLPGTTETSASPVDPNAVELDTSVDVEEFVSPAGALAVIGNRRYLLQTDATLGKRLVVEEGGSSTVLKAWSKDDIYGVGVRNGALYYAVVPDDQSATRSAVNDEATRHNLISHDNSGLKTLGTFVLNKAVFVAQADGSVALQDKIQLMATSDGTRFRFGGYENVGNGPEVIVPDPNQYLGGEFFRYHEINTLDGMLSYIGNHQYRIRYPAGGAISTQEAMFTFDQTLISSNKNTFFAGGGGSSTTYKLQGTAADSSVDQSALGRLDKAVISNGRLLMTSAPYTAGQEGFETSYPAKLYSFNSTSRRFVELATCE